MCDSDGVETMCVSIFFFKQKTAYEIVSRDWSSDVCSSDLAYMRRVWGDDDDDDDYDDDDDDDEWMSG